MRPLILLAALAAAAPALAQDGPAIGWAMGRALAGVDRDGDGVFTPEEIGPSARNVPAEFDLDGDGAFSVVELSQGFFALYDADDSGMLEPQELQAMRGLAAAGLYEMDI